MQGRFPGNDGTDIFVNCGVFHIRAVQNCGVFIILLVTIVNTLKVVSSRSNA